MIDLENKWKDYYRIVLGSPNKNAYQVGEAILFSIKGNNVVGMITQLKNEGVIVKAINGFPTRILLSTREVWIFPFKLRNSRKRFFKKEHFVTNRYL